MFKNLFYIIYM